MSYFPLSPLLGTEDVYTTKAFTDVEAEPEEQPLLYGETLDAYQQQHDPLEISASPTPTSQHALVERVTRSHTGRRRVRNRAGFRRSYPWSILIWFVTIITFIQFILKQNME